MRFVTATLGEIAPANSISLDRDPEDLVWQVTLDHIEADTGTLLKKERKPFAKAGASTHGFDNRHVLYSKLRPYLNKVLVPDEEGIGTTELVPMLPDPERLDRRYLAHYLMTKRFVAWITEHSSGAKMPRATMADFWAHEIPLPPLPEQRRIAAILDKADAIRRKRQQAIELTDQFLRSVFLDLFGDPKENLNSRNSLDLGEVCEFIAGSTLPEVEPYRGQDNGIAAFKVGDMNQPGNESLLKVPREWAPRFFRKHAYAPAGTIVFPKRGGAIATNKKRILAVDAVLDPNLMGVVSTHQSVPTQYLRFWFEMLDLASISNGSTVPQLNRMDLAPLRLRIPTDSELARFLTIQAAAASIIGYHASVLREAGDLLAAASQEAFSGEL